MLLVLFDDGVDLDPDLVLDTDIVDRVTALDLLERRAREWFGVSR